jgi:hypothetical protein
VPKMRTITAANDLDSDSEGDDDLSVNTGGWVLRLN